MEAEHPLYEAGVGFLVSDQSRNDSWKKIAQYVAGYQHSSASSTTPIVQIIQELQVIFEGIETKIKADFSLAKMPAAWRSAKSTALKALEMEVVLVSAGEVVPKSVVGRLIRAKGVATTETQLDKCLGLLTSLAGEAGHLPVNDFQYLVDRIAIAFVLERSEVKRAA